MVRTAVDHAVSHDIDVGRFGNRLRLAAPQALEQALNGLRARARRGQVLSETPREFLIEYSALPSSPLDLPLPNASRRILWERISNFVETALLAAGAGVENKTFIRVSTVTA